MITIITISLGVAFFALFAAFAVAGNSPNERRRAKKGGCQ